MEKLGGLWWVIVVAVLALLLVRLVRRRGRGPAPIVRFFGDGSYDEDVVGESAFQPALERIAGRTEDGVELECEARLVPEPRNRHDPSAIRVEIDGSTVGYIPREATAAYHAELKGRLGLCDALIVGGWERGRRGRGHFGVKLDIEYPLSTQVWKR